MRTKVIAVVAIVALGISLDLWTKAWAKQDLEGAPPVEIVANYFHLTYVENPHGAFSLFQGIPEGVRKTGLIAASVLAVVVISILVFRPGVGWWLTSAFALVLAGAIGNLYDRIFLGHVRDFIDWHYHREFTWPTFNLADSYISVGVTILVVATLFSRPGKVRQQQAEAEPETAGRTRRSGRWRGTGWRGCDRA